MQISEKIAGLLTTLRSKKPLVHHITNYVTVNDCANITLAIGAAPVMADDVSEVRDMTAMASSLVLNIGTLNNRHLESMLASAETAKELGIPIVLDSVGVGATAFRLEAANRIIKQAKPTVVKGNISEIKALYGLAVKAKGVDAVETLGANEHGVMEAATLAKELAKKLSTIVVITGKTDIVTDGEVLYTVSNGNEMMSRVTGTGCMCTSLIASYLGTGVTDACAALAGVVSMGIAGDIALERLDKKLEGTGSFKVYLMDAISNLAGNDILERGKIYEA